MTHTQHRGARHVKKRTSNQVCNQAYWPDDKVRVVACDAPGLEGGARDTGSTYSFVLGQHIESVLGQYIQFVLGQYFQSAQHTWHGKMIQATMPRASEWRTGRMAYWANGVLYVQPGPQNGVLGEWRTGPMAYYMFNPGLRTANKRTKCG